MTDLATPTTNTDTAVPPPDVLHVCADTTPGAHRTDNDDIYWWLPIIGPTATVLAHTLTRDLPSGGRSWDTFELAQRIGLAGNRNRLFTSLNRLDRFGVARFHATDVITVRVWLPALTNHQLDRYPAEMIAAYWSLTETSD